MIEILWHWLKKVVTPYLILITCGIGLSCQNLPKIDNESHILSHTLKYKSLQLSNFQIENNYFVVKSYTNFICKIRSLACLRMMNLD